MIDGLASAPQYRAHVEPVLRALGESAGTLHESAILRPGPPVIVASNLDARRSLQRTAIYLEHGSGQTYSPDHPNYAGGRGRDHVGLFLSPSERVAEINRARYPRAVHAAIGCPLIDEWHGYKPKNAEPVIAFAWHWEGYTVAPEARSAFSHYAGALPDLPYKLLGHGHPRAIRLLARYYEQNGIEWTPNFSDVIRRADVLVFDNTSAGFMFAALDRPVVVLDAPWYRRAYGGRFWEWADVGVRISDPADLSGAIAAALVDSPDRRSRRRAITEQIYGVVDGKAGQRAAAAIGDVFGQAVAA